MMEKLLQMLRPPKKPMPDPFDVQANALKPIMGPGDLIPEYVEDRTGSPALGFAAGFVNPAGMLRKKPPMKQDIFIGDKAKTWDATRAQAAQDLLRKGVNPHAKTGVHAGAEGKLRQEIDDSLSAMKVTKEQLLATPDGMRMADVLDHPELYKAYPEFADIKVYGRNRGSSSFKPEANIFELGTEGYTDLRSPLLHEAQHKIQELQRWGKGGNPGMFNPIMPDLNEVDWSKISPVMQKYNIPGDDMGMSSVQFLEDLAHQLHKAGASPAELYPLNRQLRNFRDRTILPTTQYRNLAGEVESRLVQDRLRMSKQHRGFADPVQHMESSGYPINNQTLYEVERSVPPPGSINQPMMAVDKLRAKKPLTEKQFYNQYVQHVDLRNRGKETAQSVRDKIMSEGFRGGKNVNALPPSRGGKPLNVIDAKYAPQAGDTVYLAPKGQWVSGPNGPAIAAGWKPAPHEVVTVDDPTKSMYQYYLDSFLKDQQ
jgi:hypothetical protein